MVIGVRQITNYVVAVIMGNQMCVALGDTFTPDNGSTPPPPYETLRATVYACFTIGHRRYDITQAYVNFKNIMTI